MSETSTIVKVELPTGGGISVKRRRFRGQGDGPKRRVSLVAGIRGDAPEGIRVAHRVACFLEENEQVLSGTVDIYPCANPLAAHSGTRRWPFFEVDLNRTFPGNLEGHPPDRVAHILREDVRGSDQVIELRGARPAFREAPQAHVRANSERAADLAMKSNVAVVWCRRPGPAAPATFTHHFPGTIVLEGGTGNRLTPGVGRDLANGVLHMLTVLGVLPEDILPFHWAGMQRPMRVTDEQVIRVRASRGGLFLPEGELWSEIDIGAPLGEVIDPLSGETIEKIVNPASGHVMALREHPVVYPGSMVARVVSS